MATRPIFVPGDGQEGLVREIPVAFAWHPGFATVQKKKNVRALHEGAARLGLAPLLEISTKSGEPLGQALSAFNLRVRLSSGHDVALECAFQGSKVFEHGGPYTDLYQQDPRAAKRDPRLQTSGRIVGFRFEDAAFSTQPTTAFYDWLYLNAALARPEWLASLPTYAGFTDIEFNPARSLNCQARTCALWVALQSRGVLTPDALQPVNFLALVQNTPAPDGPVGL